MFAIKRVYEPAQPADGQRVLVERLWPRGMTRQKAAVDLWLKEIAPSPELRKWFRHDPQKWSEFRERYRNELKANPQPVIQLRQMAAEGQVTLVYAAHDPQHNSALLLKEFLEEQDSGS